MKNPQSRTDPQPVVVVSGVNIRRNRFLYRLTGVIMALAALTFVVIDLYPYLFSIVASLRGGNDVYSNGWKLSELTVYAYKRILFDVRANEQLNIPQWMGNSALVAVSTTAFTLLFCSLAGYALARLDFRGKKLWFSMILAVMMVPGQVTMISKYILITKVFGWFNTYTGLIVPFLFSPYYTFMMRQFFLSFPKEIEEAAIMDGMSRFGVFTKMVLPLSKSPLMTAGILLFMGSWGSYLWPKLLIASSDKFMIQQGMTFLMDKKAYGSTPAIPIAASIVTMLPLLVLFSIFQKQIMMSVANTGSKGS